MSSPTVDHIDLHLHAGTVEGLAFLSQWHFTAFAARFRMVLRSWDISGNAEILTQAESIGDPSWCRTILFPHEVHTEKKRNVEKAKFSDAGIPEDRVTVPASAMNERNDVPFSAPNLTETQRLALLRRTLEETFQLTVRKQRRETDVYVLQRRPGIEPKLPTATSTGSSHWCRDGDITAVSVPSPFIIRIAQRVLGRAILDKTRLNDRFDFELKWDPASPGRLSKRFVPNWVSNLFGPDANWIIWWSSRPFSLKCGAASFNPNRRNCLDVPGRDASAIQHLTFVRLSLAILGTFILLRNVPRRTRAGKGYLRIPYKLFAP